MLRRYVLRVPNLELCSQLVTLLQQLVDRTQPLEVDLADQPDASDPLQQSGELGELGVSQEPGEQLDSGATAAAKDAEPNARLAQEELEKTMMQVRMQAADASALASKMQAALEACRRAEGLSRVASDYKALVDKAKKDKGDQLDKKVLFAGLWR